VRFRMVGDRIHVREDACATRSLEHIHPSERPPLWQPLFHYQGLFLEGVWYTSDGVVARATALDTTPNKGYSSISHKLSGFMSVAA
jgi:hypothetical protein